MSNRTKKRNGHVFVGKGQNYADKITNIIEVCFAKCQLLLLSSIFGELVVHFMQIN